MLTREDVYNPEFRLQQVETRDAGDNLDSELLAAFKDTEDTLALALQGALETRDIRDVNSRTIAPLFSAGLLSQDAYNTFNKLAYYAGVVSRNHKTLPRATPPVSRYARPTEADDRMPGSCLPLSKKQMRLLIREAESLKNKFDKLSSRVKRPQGQEALRKAMRAH